MSPFELFALFIIAIAICAAGIVFVLRTFQPFEKKRWIVQIVILTIAMSVPPVGAFVLYQWVSSSQVITIASSASSIPSIIPPISSAADNPQSQPYSGDLPYNPGPNKNDDLRYGPGSNNIYLRYSPGPAVAASAAPSLQTASVAPSLQTVSAAPPLQMASAAPSPPDDPRMIGVLFATNRVIDQNEEGEVGYGQISSNRSPELRYGTAAVRIPEIHHIGKVERPSDFTIFGFTIWRTQENQKNHFTLRSTKTIPRSRVIELLENAKDEGALVFVHGFNVSFSDAVFKTAQIAFDTHFRGVPIAFSWPSRASVTEYDYDRESALFSRDAFLTLLHLIENDGAITKVYVVAHSMGNQIVLDAIAHAQDAGIKLALTEVIMAAPDVDRDVFASVIGRVKNVTKGLTLYASSADKALVVSRIKAGGVPRAGDVPEGGPILASGLDSIDVTSLGDDLFALNHGVFSSSRILIDDIGRLLFDGTRPPDVRTPELLRVPDTLPTKYWRYPM